MCIQIAAIVGFVVGAQSKPTMKMATTSVTITCGYNEFGESAFERINNEAPRRAEEVFGKKESDQIFISIIPQSCGYGINYGAHPNSTIWNDRKREMFNEWVSDRIFEIQELDQVSTAHDDRR